MLRVHSDLTPLKREIAEALAMKVLGWIARSPEDAAPFLSASGVEPRDLRDRVADPEFLGFVLDWLMQDEATLLQFCSETGTDPTRPVRARAALPGGDAPHWT